MLLSARLLLVSLVLHEIAHVHAAGRLGDPTPALLGRRTLNPLAHMDSVGTIVVPGLLMLAGLPVVGWMRPVPLHEQLLTPSGVEIGRASCRERAQVSECGGWLLRR